MKALVAITVLATTSATATGCDESLLDPMAFRQPRARAYKASQFYADGLDMRPPPAGAVAREWRQPSVPRATGLERRTGPLEPNGQIAPRYAAKIPIPVTLAALTRGQERFEIFCAACHGLLGNGNSVVARQMALRPPPSLHTYGDRPPGYLFAVVTNGFGVMPGYAREMTVDDRWAVVAYLEALILSQSARADSLPAEVRARLNGAGQEGGPP
jgi:mono/diheme cytochrome c family protein